jgi:MFS transporter, DHA1 family, multidrug resistance protein
MRNVYTLSPEAASPLSHGLLIALLTLLTALGQFGSNIFLPGLPALAGELHVSPTQAVGSFGLYLASFGCAQLLAGPLADRRGRRTVALWGILIFVLGACASALAPSLPALLLARFVQGIGAAFTVVAARASARDNFEGAELARVMATITIAFAAVPAFAPLLGGVLTQYVGWRSTLWVSALAGVVVGWLVWRYMPLSHRPLAASKQSPSSHHTGAVYAQLLRDFAFLRYAMVGALAIGAMSAFFGVSPRLFLDVLKVSPLEYGLYPPIAVCGFVLGGLLTRRMSGRWQADALLRAGAAIQLAGIAMLLLPATMGLLSIWQINTGMVVFVSGLGVLMPVSMAAAMSTQNSHAGQTAALIGFVQMLFGSAGALLGSALMDQWPHLGMQLSMFAFSLANLFWIFGNRVFKVSRRKVHCQAVEKR